MKLPARPGALMGCFFGLLLRRCCKASCKLILTSSMLCGVSIVQAAAPTWQATGTAVSGTGAVSPAWPTHAVNDVALLFVESTGGQAATLSTSAGFVAVSNSPQATGATTAGTRLTVFWARATSISMATPTVADPGDHVYAQIISYRNVFRTGNPWDVTGGGVKAGASTALTVTGVTTTIADTLVVQAAAREDDASGAEFSAQTNANLVGIASRSDAGTTSGNGGGFAVWDGQMVPASATGGTTATVTSSINAFLTIALKPDIFEVTEAASAASVPINTNFTLTFAARNPVNGSTQTGITITDHLTSAGLTFASFTPSVGTYTFTAGVLTWSVGPMTAGTAASATLIVRAATAGSKTNTITSNIGTPVASASATVQAYAPLADWRMDEAVWNGTANEVKDSSGGGYHGKSKVASGPTPVASTATGSPAYTSGSQNTCRYGEFDKTTITVRSYSYVELSSLPALPSSFTFAAWIKSSNPSYIGQRILVRDDADNGWSFSLGDAGSARLRFFNRNISPSGAAIGDGSNNRCGSVFCLDSGAVITAGNWFFVAVSIDTTGKVITNYLYNAAGTLVSSTSSAFSGTWKDGTGTAAIGGETSASGELPSNYHFQGNVDEMQIYSGVLSQSNLDVLLTRSRTCGVSVDHYELSLPTASLTCLPSAVTVTACADASSPCTNAVTTINGQTATLASAGATLGTGTVTFNASGVATTTLSYPLAADGTAVSVALSAEQATATNPRKCCPNGTSCVVGSSCSTTFNTAGFIVSSTAGGTAATIPTQTAGTSSSSYYLRAVKTSTTTQACESALSGTQNVNWAAQCNNPTTCSTGNLMSLSGNASTASGSSPIASNPNTGVSSTTPLSMTFDANGNAPFSFNYADAGQVTLSASKAASGSLLSALAGNSNAFVVKPATLVATATTAAGGANPGTTTTGGSAFMAAGDAFTVNVKGFTSDGVTPTPNFGNETNVAAATFVDSTNVAGKIYSLVTPTTNAPSSGVLTTGTSANGNSATAPVVTGTVKVTGNAWSEVGAFTLKPYLSNYLGAGVVSGTPTATIGRFRPYQYAFSGNLAVCSSPTFAYVGQPLAGPLTVTAQNKQAGTTTNYGKGATSLATLTPTQITFGALTAGLAVDTASSLYNLAFASAQDFNTRGNGTAQIAVAVPVKMTTTPSSPITSGLTISATTDEVATVAGAPVSVLSGVPATTEFRLGRVRLLNAYGSELLALPVPIALEYVSSVVSAVPVWSPNTLDTCTSVSSNNFSFNFATPAGTAAKPNNLSACETEIAVTGTPPNQKITLSQPGSGNAGWAQLTLNMGATSAAAVAANSQCSAVGGAGGNDLPANLPWLQTAAGVNPRARATFGIYKSPLIYRRENY